jgi:hypothetical protein
VRDPEEGLTGQPPVPGSYARLGDRFAGYIVAIGIERWARVGAVALVPLFFVPDGTRSTVVPFILLASYVAVTALLRRSSLLRIADLLVAAALIVGTRGQIAPFLPYLIVAVAAPAAAGGVRAGVAAGGGLAGILLVTLAWVGALPELGLGGVVPAAFLLPLAGLTTASAAQILDDRAVQSRLALEEANRLLSSLRAIADDLPGGLDVSTVSAALLAEIRTIEGARASIVFTEVDGLFQPTASSGVSLGAIPSLRVDELREVATAPGGSVRFLTPRALPHSLHPLARAHRHWAVLGVGRDGTLAGVLLLGFDDVESARSSRSRLSSLALDGRSRSRTCACSTAPGCAPRTPPAAGSPATYTTGSRSPSRTCAWSSSCSR